MSFITRRGTAPGLEVIRTTDNGPLLVCCQHLAIRAQRLHSIDRLADRRTWADRWVDPLDPVREAEATDRLQQHLAVLLEEFETALADPVAGSAITGSTRPWPDAAPRLLELMLTAGTAALATEPSLAALIADTVLLSRRGSRAAWRLRARAHEQWGDLGTAITAHQRYLSLLGPDPDRLGVRAKVSELRELQITRTALAAALGQAEQLGLRLPRQETAELRERLPQPIRQDTLDPILEDFITDLTRLPMPDLIAATDVLHAAIRCRRTGALHPGPLPAADLRKFTVLRLNDVRSWLAGRTICLVADVGRLGGEPAGAQIDSYDLVARFAPFRLEPAITGSRTDLLVSSHDDKTSWRQPTDLRMVLAEDPRDWLRSVRRNLVPGAQRGLLDKALRRPAHQSALLSDDVRPGRPTGVFQLLRLLDHLDVNPRIDLIGFTLEEPAAGPAGAFLGLERDWLRTRAHQVDQQRISLR